LFSNTEITFDQDLICPVPYDPLLRRADNTRPTVEVKVDVYDGNTNDRVEARLFTQNGSLTATEIASDETSNAASGVVDTLVLTYSPTASTKYLWIVVNVPNVDAGRSSRVRGYQVRRF
jgi:hypothetical protein